jgi:hypothetical protein
VHGLGSLQKKNTVGASFPAPAKSHYDYHGFFGFVLVKNDSWWLRPAQRK